MTTTEERNAAVLANEFRKTMPHEVLKLWGVDASFAILAMLDELATLRSERTAWRVTAENAETSVKQARIDALEEARRLVWKNDTAAGADRAIESLKGQP